LEATDQEIRKAYRQRSLKVHPDRVSTCLICMDSF
jgi:curved DNA-binding protein CbpA